MEWDLPTRPPTAEATRGINKYTGPAVELDAIASPMICEIWCGGSILRHLDLDEMHRLEIGRWPGDARRTMATLVGGTKERHRLDIQ